MEPPDPLNLRDQPRLSAWTTLGRMLAVVHALLAVYTLVAYFALRASMSLWELAFLVFLPLLTAATLWKLSSRLPQQRSG